jgi:hypothetical protein
LVINTPSRNGVFQHNTVFAVVANGGALVGYPNSMLLALLTGCMVCERGGTRFQGSNYAHTDRYQEWLKTQQLVTRFPSDTQKGFQ